MQKEFHDVEVMGLKHAIRSMRDIDGSWNKSDSGVCKGGDGHIGCENCVLNKNCNHSFDHEFKIGKRDMELAHALLRANDERFMTMIHVQADTNDMTLDTNYHKLRRLYRRWLKSTKDTDEEIAFINLIATLPYAKELIMYKGDDK